MVGKVVAQRGLSANHQSRECACPSSWLVSHMPAGYETLPFPHNCLFVTSFPSARPATHQHQWFMTSFNQALVGHGKREREKPTRHFRFCEPLTLTMAAWKSFASLLPTSAQWDQSAVATHIEAVTFIGAICLKARHPGSWEEQREREGKQQKERLECNFCAGRWLCRSLVDSEDAAGGSLKWVWPLAWKNWTRETSMHAHTLLLDVHQMNAPHTVSPSANILFYFSSQMSCSVWVVYNCIGGLRWALCTQTRNSLRVWSATIIKLPIFSVPY